VADGGIQMIFKKGDRVFMKDRGYGTVVRDTYNNIYFATSTPVKWDDYLGQKLPLAENTKDLVDEDIQMMLENKEKL
jgi:hypothetical protein